MKKLIVMAVAVAMGIAAQAAQVTWTASAIAQAPSSSTSYYAYLVDVSGLTSTYATAEDVALALHDGSFSGTVMYSATATYNASKSVVAIAQSKKDLPSSYQGGDTGIQYYSIVFDAANAAEAKYWMSTGVNADGTVKSADISAAGLMTIAHQSQASNTWTEVAPEPTSGMMMLLGMGLLALRRRRA